MVNTTKVQDILSKVNSDTGKLVLLYLSDVQKAAVREIAEALDITLSETYSITKSLREKGIISQVDGTVYELSI